MIHPNRTEPVWDILVLSVLQRADKLAKLLKVLEPQLNDKVAVLILTDNQDYDVGHKRTKLLAASQAEYVSFIDDDDMVSKDYVSSIFPYLNGLNEFIGFEMTYLQNGKPNKMKKPVKINPKYRDWWEDSEAWWKDIYHIGVIKRAIAERFEFSGMQGEDGRWAGNIREAGLVDKYAYVNKPLYTYDKVDGGTLTEGYS